MVILENGVGIFVVWIRNCGSAVWVRVVRVFG